MDEINESRPSWPYPTILFFYFIIIFFIPEMGREIGLTLYFALMAISIWLALSRKQYEGMVSDYPSVSRQSYIANMLIFPVIIPILVISVLLFINYPN